MLVVMPVISAPSRGCAIVLMQQPIVGRDVGKAVKILGSQVLDAHVQVQDIVEELAWEFALLEALLGKRVRVVQPYVAQQFS